MRHCVHVLITNILEAWFEDLEPSPTELEGLRITSTQEELELLLRKAGITYDPKYPS